MTEPLFPEPLADDDDDVAWALQTAKVQWNRGGRADAIVWLQRAADSADRLGNIWRAADLRRIAQYFSQTLGYAEPDPLPLPAWPMSHDLADAEESGVTSIPPLAAPLSSYAPVDVDDFEVEEDVELFEEQVPADAQAALAQLLGSDVERTSVVEIEIEEEDDELDADVIDDDALDVLAEPSTEPQALDLTGQGRDFSEESVDEPVTQPHLGDIQFLDIANRSRLASPGALAPVLGPAAEPQLGDVLLGEVRGLEDVPPEGQAILVREARIERLAEGEEVSSFGLALILRGAVSVMPTVADLSCARAGKGEIVWSQGNLEEGIALRLVAVLDSTEVAVWDAELLKSTVRDYPWVVADLKTLADRYQALAGVAMGPMGERLDDALRATVTDRCEIKRLLPGESLTTQAKAVGGMYIVAAGRIEVVDGNAVESELGPGDFLFAPQVLSNGAAPRDSRAGAGGALVLFAARSVAHELLLSVPPLLEIFAT